MRIYPVISFLIAFVSGILSHAQTYNFHHFSEQDGLYSKYIYTINQDANGLLLLGTTEGLYTYNGFRFLPVAAPDSLQDNLITYSYDKKGEHSILYGYDSGKISIYSNGRLDSLPLSEKFNSRITGICEDENKNLWISSQNSGIVRIGSDNQKKHITAGLEDYTILSFAIKGPDEFWMGTDLGLIKARLISDNTMETVMMDEFPVTNVTDLRYAANGKLLVATEDAGAFFVSSAAGNIIIEPIMCAVFDLAMCYMKEIREDENRNIWLSTNQKGLIELVYDQSTGTYSAIEYINDGLSGVNSVRCTYTDREGILWIGTIGSGVYRLEDDFFATFNLSPNEDRTVYSIGQVKDSLWIGGTGNVLLTGINPKQVLAQYDAKNKLPADKIISVLQDSGKNIYAGTEESGLWKMNNGSTVFKKLNFSDGKLEQKINDILEYRNEIYVATDFGVFILHDDHLIKQLSIEDGLSGNVVRSFFQDSKGRIWIATTTSEISYIENGELNKINSPISDLSVTVKCFEEDLHNNIWMGTEGFGLINITDTTLRIFQKQDGLYSDFCYSIICDSQNRMWVGHRGAMSRVDLQNDEIIILAPGVFGETDFEDNAVIRLANGNLLFGTNNGVVSYNQERDKPNLLEPVLNITSLRISDVQTELLPLIALKNGDYKFEIDFIGISLREPGGVMYQFYLDGYDNDWSAPTTEHFARYNHLAPGTYTFKVKCYNSDGIGGFTIKEIVFKIARPFWQSAWFIALCFLTIFLIVWIVIRRRERLLRQNQEYLKKALAERTHEVVMQKELLEIKNKDITDSIVYAKNIQTAVLPSHQSIRQYFEDAFIYYKPRDIVSGDFYWIKKIDDRIVLACADCTGHGVPGAFMSLIGSILLREISDNPEATDPAKYLTLLDHELQSLLNKKMQNFQISDGIDISIIELNTRTSELKISGSQRPVIIYQKGKRIEIKGDRRSIGLNSAEKEKPPFTLNTIQMEAGDSIYMFSDGITDQFGGKSEKKLKISGLREILDEIVQLDMSRQRGAFKDHFKKWKGPLDQVDDIILIGIKV